MFGAGPAGCSAALTLLNHSDLKVVIVEQSDFQQIRVGENVSARILSLIDYLQIDRSRLDAHSMISTHSTTAYWGSEIPVTRDSIFYSENNFQLDREAFDLMLIDEFVKKDGVVFPRSRCQRLEGGDGDGPWRATLKHPSEGVFQISARYVIDASGRTATIGKKIGVQRELLDQLVGVGAFFQFSNDVVVPQEQTIESVEDGWWHCSTLPDNRVVVTFFCDPTLVSEQRLSLAKNWMQLLCNTKHIVKRIEGSTFVSEDPWIRNASTLVSHSSHIRRFLSVGDAACSFDPISSMGVGFAVSSGCQAAVNIIADAGRSGDGSFDTYHQSIQQNLEPYLNSRKVFYQKETRWQESSFWSKR